MQGVVGTIRASAVAALWLAAAPAFANPHVWVEARITFELEAHRVQGIRFAWRFDDFYSSHAIRTHDLDGDGALGPGEVRALRAEAFDPLAESDYFVHIRVGEARRGRHDVDRFAARVEDDRLLWEFSVSVTPPADPADGPVAVSVFDRDNVVDFRLAESDFLRVDGEVGAGCGFRVGGGRGEQAGHPGPVTLACGG